jgi:hypothetical protein
MAQVRDLSSIPTTQKIVHIQVIPVLVKIKLDQLVVPILIDKYLVQLKKSSQKHLGVTINTTLFIGNKSSECRTQTQGLLNVCTTLLFFYSPR